MLLVLLNIQYQMFIFSIEHKIFLSKHSELMWWLWSTPPFNVYILSLVSLWFFRRLPWRNDKRSPIKCNHRSRLPVNERAQLSPAISRQNCHQKHRKRKMRYTFVCFRLKQLIKMKRVWGNIYPKVGRCLIEWNRAPSGHEDERVAQLYADKLGGLE